MSFSAAGALDRKIVIEQPTVTRNAIGEATKAWSTFATVFASVTPTTAREYRGAQSIRSVKMTSFIVRYLSGLREDMRISFDSRYYRITGINEVGRKEGLEVFAESIQ